MVKTQAKDTNQEIPVQAVPVDEEIDLFEIIQTLNKKKKLIGITTLAFFVLGVLIFFVYPKKYKYAFMVQVNPLIMVQVNPLIITSPGLNLGINTDVLMNILKIKYDSKINPRVNELPYKIKLGQLTQGQNHIQITIEVRKKEELDQVINEVRGYLNNYPLIIEKKEILKNFKEQSLMELEKSINLGRKITDTLLAGRQQYLLDLSSGSKLNFLDLKSFEFQLKLINEEEFFVFYLPEKPEEPTGLNPLLVIGSSLVAGLFVGIFLALFMEYYEKQKGTSPL
ncbi:MAG: Wzz/FepE/Etk N-terminal domain-containing protein [Leptospiraceae bacterium]|nr:Wzz/FepE/Etk N-terminal domain-containing protein [Leptospiraceae bacterium]MDW7976376.1 Wzz/FepE/Etk N-terminal domain-containing protein [Leptospiraceae bacterium]